MAAGSEIFRSWFKDNGATSAPHTLKSEPGWNQSCAGPASTVHFVRPPFRESTTLLLFILNQLLRVRVDNHRGDVEFTSISRHV